MLAGISLTSFNQSPAKNTDHRNVAANYFQVKYLKENMHGTPPGPDLNQP